MRNSFENRHLGPNASERKEMLKTLGLETVDQLIDKTVPQSIRMTRKLNIPEALSEADYLKEINQTAQMNQVFKSHIGMGYYDTHTPSVILRNIFENPAWYTQYTPYQAEISQGRLEALFIFQTLVSDLTGLPIANASLLDEGTAAAEAMNMFFHAQNKRSKTNEKNILCVAEGVMDTTIEILKTRTAPLGIELQIANPADFDLNEKVFAILLQYPDKEGIVNQYNDKVEEAKEKKINIIVAADLLSLTLLEEPAAWGADAVVGTTQRFGVPMGFGGPHAAYFATTEKYKRQIPGRIIGLSQDIQENPAYRMALQTREQHIKREKATSNICTAQALLAIMAGMYAVYHGPDGLKEIAQIIHDNTNRLFHAMKAIGVRPKHGTFFDTITVPMDKISIEAIRKGAVENEMNFHYGAEQISISLDETTTVEDVTNIVQVFATALSKDMPEIKLPDGCDHIIVKRESAYLQAECFNSYHSETQMMRFIKRLESKDLSLVHSMIPLGSCTMKLNAASELIPVSLPQFGKMHPFAPLDQTLGYQKIFKELEAYLAEVTGFTACSVQPNSGAQGEYAGLLTIQAYHKYHGNTDRKVALIPSSAHGTNPASAVMVGLDVVIVACDDNGNIDMADLVAKADEYKDTLACFIVTYPSTHGVFEAEIKEMCAKIHDCGGLIYMDGANMNAQIGLTSPGLIGADVCHLNLHKTFAIPHGGGGPGVGPICCNDKLKPFLPGHIYVDSYEDTRIKAVSSAPWGSASILLISYAYVKMLGAKGLLSATQTAILNANYITARLENDYDVLYRGHAGMSAHEMILDLRPYKAIGVSAEDVAKRLMDYGFHAPTLSFPVAGTIMIEPTESEDKDELDRFIDALLSIKAEINAMADGSADPDDNLLNNAPHTLAEITADEWTHTYSRAEAAYPLDYLREGRKFWASTKRVNNAYGDRHLVCTCAPIEAYT